MIPKSRSRLFFAARAGSGAAPLHVLDAAGSVPDLVDRAPDLVLEVFVSG